MLVWHPKNLVKIWFLDLILVIYAIICIAISNLISGKANRNIIETMNDYFKDHWIQVSIYTFILFSISTLIMHFTPEIKRKELRNALIICWIVIGPLTIMIYNFFD